MARFGSGGGFVAGSGRFTRFGGGGGFVAGSGRFTRLGGVEGFGEGSESRMRLVSPVLLRIFFPFMPRYVASPAEVVVSDRFMRRLSASENPR